MGGTPEITFRHGACSASVFVNTHQSPTGEESTIRSVSFQRRYRDKHGAWQETNTLKVNDIPKAVLVLSKAYEYLTANAFGPEEE